MQRTSSGAKTNYWMGITLFYMQSTGKFYEAQVTRHLTYLGGRRRAGVGEVRGQERSSTRKTVPTTLPYRPENRYSPSHIRQEFYSQEFYSRPTVPGQTRAHLCLFLGRSSPNLWMCKSVRHVYCRQVKAQGVFTVVGSFFNSSSLAHPWSNAVILAVHTHANLARKLN